MWIFEPAEFGSLASQIFKRPVGHLKKKKLKCSRNYFY